jgi:hypothetical protein
MIANNHDGSGVLKVIENFKASDIPCGSWLEYMNVRLNDTTTTTADIRGCFLRMYGDLYYVLNFKAQASVQTSLRLPTIAFNFSTGVWVELRYGSVPFPIAYTCDTGTTNITTYVAGNSTYSFYGPLGGQDRAIDYLEGVGGDTSNSIQQEIRTSNLDFGTLNQKAMHRVGVRVRVMNKVTYAVAANYELSLYYSDDDYQTYSAARTVNIRPPTTSGVSGFPFLTQLGMFRERSFKLSYSSRFYLEYEDLELDINKGQQ